MPKTKTPPPPTHKRNVVTYAYAYEVPGLPARVSLCLRHGKGEHDPATGRPLGRVEHGLHYGLCAACEAGK